MQSLRAEPAGTSVPVIRHVGRESVPGPLRQRETRRARGGADDEGEAMGSATRDRIVVGVDGW
jgi:hypothetical protein